MYVSIFGFLGALASDLIKDNSIELPKKEAGKICLGSLGGLIIGGIAGYLIDGSPLTAFMAGFTGISVIKGLVDGQIPIIQIKAQSLNEKIIRKIATEQGVDPDIAVRVATCESKLNEKAINTNAQGSRDRGLFQINDKYHPEVSDAEAFNPIFATEFFCKAFKAGNLSWWNATKSCWEK